MHENVIYDVWLSTIFPIGSTKFKELKEIFGSTKEIFLRGKNELDFGKDAEEAKLAFEAQNLCVAEAILKRCERERVGILTSEEYPFLLRQIPDMPTILYYSGNIGRLQGPLLTIVGTRRPDGEGKRIACKFSKAVKEANIQVVSGFAQGIEAEVHKTVRSTIAVLPNGINVTYPANNWRLKREILDNDGLLLTEYPFDTRALKYNFRPRNRILAALSTGTLIIQSPTVSGTKHTFGYAAEYGRDCYVVPGSIENPNYDGANEMIKDGAIPVTCPEDIIEQYAREFSHIVRYELPKTAADVNKTFDFEEDDGHLDENEKRIMEALSGRILNIDEISIRAELAVSTVSAILTTLEIMGYVEKKVGNRYQIK